MAIKYYEYPNQYVTNMRLLDKRQRMSWQEFYKTQRAVAMLGSAEGFASASQHNQIALEEIWFESKRPYYLFHPNMLDILEPLNFPEMPAKMIQFPFQVFVVQFPEGEERLAFNDGKNQLRSVLCWRGSLVRKKPPSLEEILQRKREKERHLDPSQISITSFLQPQKPLEPEESMWESGNYVVMFMDFGEVSGPFRTPVYTYKQLQWKGDETIEEAAKALPDDDSMFQGLKIPQALVNLGMKLTMSVGFLAKENNILVRPHVLKDDVGYLQTADEKQLDMLHKRAVGRRNDTIGWVVGDDEYIPKGRRLGDIQGVGPSEPSGRRLRFQHVVGIHWKVVRFGPGMSQGEPRLILPYTRGKGLPFKQD